MLWKILLSKDTCIVRSTNECTFLHGMYKYMVFFSSNSHCSNFLEIWGPCNFIKIQPWGIWHKFKLPIGLFIRVKEVLCVGHLNLILLKTITLLFTSDSICKEQLFYLLLKIIRDKHINFHFIHEETEDLYSFSALFSEISWAYLSVLFLDSLFCSTDLCVYSSNTTLP